MRALLVGYTKFFLFFFILLKFDYGLEDLLTKQIRERTTST